MYSSWFTYLRKTLLVLSSLLYINGIHGFSTPSNVIFIGGLTEKCTKDILQRDFEKYGQIADISIVGMELVPIGAKKARKPFAFIQYDSEKSALTAIEASSTIETSSFYQQVKAAEPIDSTKRKRSNASRQSQKDEYEHMIDVCSKTNLILQVQSTHVDRLKEYLSMFIPASYNKAYIAEIMKSIKVEGSMSAVTKNMSLVYVSVSDPFTLAKELSKNRHQQVLARAVKKLYIVEPKSLQCDLSTKEGREIVIADILNKKMSHYESKSTDESFKLHIFPPSKQKGLLSTIEEMDIDGIISKRLNPRDANNIISIVQVYQYKGKNSNVDSSALAMGGISASFTTATAKTQENEEEEAISRAYYKLKESIERYEIENDFDKSELKGSIALDVGSAPGGWSKYLASDIGCQLVHSVDPGNLAISIHNIKHWKMKVQDAIPLIENGIHNENDKIKVFVSDACLHSMEGQIDFLLEAQEEGILASEVFFVLTLKCTIGYGKNNFDEQAKKVVADLQKRAITKDVSTFHLFSNRSGERTITGRLFDKNK